jgi:hypothetical protein
MMFDYANSLSPTNPPGDVPGGQAKIALEVCSVWRLSASEAARRRWRGMNWRWGLRWKAMKKRPASMAPELPRSAPYSHVR